MLDRRMGKCLSMETLRDTLWPIVAIGGLGALIDFLIGRTGQERAKDFLLKWWVRFDDVRWRTFGREEGLFAGALIEKWFGRRIWSVRRIVSALAVYCLTVVLVSIKAWITSEPLFRCDSVPDCELRLKTAAVAFGISFFGFLFSMSLTRVITFRLALLCKTSEVRNFTFFVIMLLVNYAMLTFWLPIIATIKDILVTFVATLDLRVFMLWARIMSDNNSMDVWQSMIFIIRSNMAAIFSTFYPETLWNIVSTPASDIGTMPVDFLASFPTLLRCTLAVVFVGSFLLKPLIMRPINLIWARIVESEKPVFTVMFGGAAAFATAIGEAAKHL